MIGWHIGKFLRTTIAVALAALWTSCRCNDRMNANLRAACASDQFMHRFLPDGISLVLLVLARFGISINVGQYY